MSRVAIAVLATMDTKGAESHFIRQEIEALGASAVLINIGVVGDVDIEVDISNEQVVRAGGASMAEILEAPTRQKAAPILTTGGSKILLSLIHEHKIDAVLALGGTQGTSICSQILQALPYGFPKVMLSTIASGDTVPFVGIKDITMMFSVSDILGLNQFSRKILANAAGAAFGMTQNTRQIASKTSEGKPLIGMTNLGVLTNGAMHAIDFIHKHGYEVITFHAIGAGGSAMEQMMKEGIIGAVFDYAMGEIADEVFGGLRAANEERLTVAGKLGIPQVICPGGAEHLGILLHTPNEVPDEYANHRYVFHSPFVFVPRLKPAEITRVAQTICQRLAHTKGKAIFYIPNGGTSRYTVAGGELRDRECDEVFFSVLKDNMPAGVEVRTHPGGVEDDEFVETAVSALLELIES
jgi:uncharacterized protein (UPF0261 family)